MFDKLAAACDEQQLTKLLTDIEQPLSQVLSSMEYTGIQVDAKGIEAFGVELRQVLAEELETIYELVGYEGEEELLGLLEGSLFRGGEGGNVVIVKDAEKGLVAQILALHYSATKKSILVTTQTGK